MENKRCCGNCRYNGYESRYDDYVCTNAESDNWGDFVPFDNECEEFEEKE